jgi:hypothetical protein
MSSAARRGPSRTARAVTTVSRVAHGPARAAVGLVRLAGRECWGSVTGGESGTCGARIGGGRAYPHKRSPGRPRPQLCALNKGPEVCDVSEVRTMCLEIHTFRVTRNMLVSGIYSPPLAAEEGD